MAIADRGARADVGLGRANGSVFFAAPRARSAVRIQACSWRGGTGPPDALSAADGSKRDRLRSAGSRSRGDPVKPSQPTRLPTTAELTVATPEGVLFRLPLAGPAPRLYAMLLDTAIVLAVVNGLGYLVYSISAKAPGFAVMTIT